MNVFVVIMQKMLKYFRRSERKKEKANSYVLIKVKGYYESLFITTLKTKLAALCVNGNEKIDQYDVRGYLMMTLSLWNAFRSSNLASITIKDMREMKPSELGPLSVS